MTGNTAMNYVLVTCAQPLDYNLLFGIDVIKVLGGVWITHSGGVEFKKQQLVCMVFYVKETNFSVKFDELQRV